MSKILVTGGAGFIGSNFVRMMLAETDHQIVNLDLLTYAGNLENLSDVESHANYRFVRGDIADAEAMAAVFSEHKPEIVVHFAAESHVDRSVLDATAFVQTNVIGTQVLLDLAGVIFQEQSTLDTMINRILTHVLSFIQCERAMVLMVHDLFRN